ncbi:FAD/FMN-containing dehydrogenase [Diaminobutyricimonas aerilata]|uniref:FAD/FMN-containing dehydrogenase n=1 Tax=Diaminobutyricimonas aerilata TaxID=1162967 RepID=A0A2M9CND4_9MICO|nr:LLM class flavin-dependent oxidoreductase [Diaminobutyricimonas aerilata]PJJ73400.1 FAD/FMN-containing dehydrogenase [Diaminobutyricimonas aerilata]
MPDYGHPLRFGTFITPAAARPENVVALARHTERVGLDLVTFQDHPYQPSFLDTLTLLTWVAAQTERVHVSANVHSLPLRPPAVLAKAAASVDLLSGGRFELGLGAGAFWDAIEGMGAQRLTTGQAVTALSEAIDVIRALWATDERTPLRMEGTYYRLRGAKRGPAPSTRIPIALGAYKPRMLRLVGEKADGWLPSQAYLGEGGLQAGNAAIDAAAEDAGRDPREVRRMLNIAPPGGDVDSWVAELVRMAVDDGVGTFILAADDPRTIQLFGEEVAPAVREAVAAERRELGTTTGTVRPRAVLAKRREGIDYDDVPADVEAIEPGDPSFGSVRSNYLRGGNPGLVLRPADVDGVARSLAFARRQPVPLGIRSGGHGVSGRSTNDGGIVLDLGRLDGIEVLDEATRRIRVGAGARWGDVAAALDDYGWALSSGDYGGVGVGGLATTGGIGWLAREHGLTIDHLRAVEVVLADGRIVRASPTEEPELFWGMRGAGGNFGIATAFEFEVDEVGAVGWVQLAHDATDLARFLQAWSAIVESSPRDLTANLIVGRSSGRIIAQTMALVDSAEADVILARVQPLADIAPLLDSSAQLTSYAAVMGNASGEPHQGRGEPVARSVLVEAITPQVAEVVQRLVESGDSHFFQVRSVGGAVSDVAPDATAYGQRGASFSLVAMGSDDTRLDRHWTRMRELGSGLYLSFETSQDPALLEQAFGAENLVRLRELKRRYDPENVFGGNFPIPPALEA